MHISNRYLDLEPVVAASADHLGWGAAVGLSEDVAEPAVAAKWVVVSPNGESLGALTTKEGWRAGTAERVTWTDDYSSVLSVVGQK